MKATTEAVLIESLFEINQQLDRIVGLLEKGQCGNTTNGGAGYTSVKDVAEAIVRAVKPDDSTIEGDDNHENRR
ncbi:hypothetical protein B5F17_14065 [Butyricicoccus pullicaecorum]|uniref:Uncharacterized protein n=1 Tax=Butyricicoccus pullicaecorum TaxID=501571 RepID=A0A1Y4L0V7_9FIRM|nr:hypothetical protein [Butyricicoccus pullicaecorum]OUP50256.1 hypothetical protein B5F17_14065 [Butyricicoccus pullicaecorum]